MMKKTSNNSLKKGSWTDEEDQKLISYINRYGIWNWSHMPKYAGLSRTGKSCRFRWVNYLKPNLKRGEFSKEEEETIIHLHSLLGNRWSAIASQLPGRTDNDVKNYWHVHLKKSVSNDGQKQLVCQTTDEPNEFSNSVPPGFGEIQEPAAAANYDHMNVGFTLEHQISSSSSTTTTSEDQQGLDLGGDYYYNNICASPGTFDDLQCFWDQLCPFENLDDMDGLSTQLVFENSNDIDPLSSYTVYNNDYNHSLGSGP